MLGLQGESAPRRRGLRLGRDTREEILNAAEDLLQRRGYNAFSYHHIAVQLGIRNAAIHYHFPSKEELGIVLVKRYRERFAKWNTGLDASIDPWHRLQMYFKTYRDYLDAEGCKCCPGGVLGNEFHVLPERMREEARELAREIYEWLIATLEEGRRRGLLRFDGAAEDKAMAIGAALQGGLQIARLAGPERFMQLLSQIRIELGVRA